MPHLMVFCLVFFISIANTFALQEPVQDAAQEQEFLPVEQAFIANLDIDAGAVNLIFNIVPGYYLYKSRFDFWLADTQGEKFVEGIQANIPEGKHKDDPYFGPVQVYYTQVVIPLRFNLSAPHKTLAKKSQLQLVYKYQGCAEAGLCYPPQTATFSLTKNILNLDTTLTRAQDARNIILDKQNGSTKTVDIDIDSAKKKATLLNPVSELNSAENLTTLLHKKNLSALVVMFFLGMLLAFTPCVLPMVPILSSIILGNKNLSSARASLLSFIYVIGMATTYALLGVVVAYFGAKANLQLYIQQPWVVVTMAVLFIVLAFSMFGFFELRLPQFIQQPVSRLNQGVAGGSVIGVFLMGIVSALVVSPCVSAPLAGTLVYIGSTGDVIFGGLSLFILALGMGVPLMLIGILGPRYLPQSGNWLNTSKTILAMLLVGVAVWLLARILPSMLDALLWGAWTLGFAYFLGAFKQATSRIANFFK